MSYREDILIHEPSVTEFGLLDQCILSSLAVYSFLKPVGSLQLLEASWQFPCFCSRLTVLFLPDGSGFVPGGDAFFAGLGFCLFSLPHVF